MRTHEHMAWRLPTPQVCGLDTDIDVIKHHGSTDPLILVGILMHHGIAKEEVDTQLGSSK